MLLAVTVAGCGSAEPAGSSQREGTPASAGHTAQSQSHGGSTSGRRGGEQAQDVAETINVRIVDGQVEPPPRRVEVDRGQRVRVKVASDEPTTVHIHGYDLEKPVSPGDPAAFEFPADTPGVFEVESHDPTLVLFQLQVR